MSAHSIISPERILFSDIPRWLKQGAIVIVGVDGDGVGMQTGSAGDAATLLSSAEQERMSRLHSTAAAERYLQQRLLLRSVLAHCCGVAASAIQYRWNRYGKPALCSDGAVIPAKQRREQNRMHFSITHSGAQLLIAISRRHEVGIDCEEYRRRQTAQRTARFVLSRRGARRASRSHRAFIRQWVLREAWVKCAGQSLYNLRAWTVTPRRTYRLALSSHFAAACVVRGAHGRQVRYCRLEGDALTRVMGIATQAASSVACHQ